MLTCTERMIWSSLATCTDTRDSAPGVIGTTPGETPTRIGPVRPVTGTRSSLIGAPARVVGGRRRTGCTDE